MLIKEYRIPLPLTVEEYRIAQLYMIAKKSSQESRGADSGSGVEILVNEPYTEGPGGQGQFTHKVYHVGSHLPGWFKSLLPASALTVEEKAWNAYPYTKTIFSCPFVEKFSLEIETFYTPDGGQMENVFNLSESEMRNRVVDLIDVVRDQDQNYVAEEDPTEYVSEKTGRGPLEASWVDDYSTACVGKEMPTPSGQAIMCAYKLCKVEFRYWGMQNKIERFIHDTALRNTMLRAHRQAWVWQDEWHGLTMDDIRDFERKTAEELKRKMRGEEAIEDEDQQQTEEALGKSFSSIEYSSQEVPNIIPKSSEMLQRKSVCLSEEESKKLIGSFHGGMQRSRKSSDQLSKHSKESNFESFDLGCNEGNESDDEFYDCPEVPEDIRSLTKWNSMELVPGDLESDDHDGNTAPPDMRQSVTEPVFKELRRTVSHQGEAGIRRRTLHPTIDIAEVAEHTCSTSVLILVVHGGSILDPATELAVRKSDVTTFRGAFESIMRQHFPGLVGHLVMKCVPCPNPCPGTMSLLSRLSPYSGTTSPTRQPSEQLPISAISLFSTAAKDYQKAVTFMVKEANKVYQNFLQTEEGAGFDGQVCLIGDSTGAMLAYDALSRYNDKSSRENSLSAENSLGQPDNSDDTFQFQVSDFFMLGSPISLVLAFRKHSSSQSKTCLELPKPRCKQVYNLFHPSNPIAARLEPFLCPSFSQLPAINIPRYQMHPLGDGQQIYVEEYLKMNENLLNQTHETSASGYLTPVRIRRLSNESFQSSILDTHQSEALSHFKESWLGEKRLDYALYCPEGLANFPTNALPHLFHASYWESVDVISFILRQLTHHEEHSSFSRGDSSHQNFIPKQAREKWIKKRTSVKIKNGAANHRGNDVIVLEGKDQVLNARFSYGPFDMVALSSERVDIHMMKEPPFGDWNFLATEMTDKNGRISYKIPGKDTPGYGVYPVKMVVRGDHTVLGLHLAVVPPKTEAVVFSIDGSFTASVSVSGKDPKVRPSSVDVVRHWQELGFLVIYVTGRPCMQLLKVKAWLSMHNFPHGLLSFADGFSTDPLGHKKEYLQQLQQDQGVILHAGYGSSKDISVYSSLGLSPSQIHIVGKCSRKQLAFCNHLNEGYAAHLESLAAPGGSRPAQGNARMLIPRLGFGLPGHMPPTLRSNSFRAESKKYSSLPVSAPPVPVKDPSRNSFL